MAKLLVRMAQALVLKCQTLAYFLRDEVGLSGQSLALARRQVLPRSLLSRLTFAFGGLSRSSVCLTTNLLLFTVVYRSQVRELMPLV